MRSQCIIRTNPSIVHGGALFPAVRDVQEPLGTMRTSLPQAHVGVGRKCQRAWQQGRLLIETEAQHGCDQDRQGFSRRPAPAGAPLSAMQALGRKQRQPHRQAGL